MKTTFTYEQYDDYASLSQKLAQLASDYPELCQCISLNEGDYRQWVLMLGDSDLDQKPAFYVDGNIHAGELTASMAALHFADSLLSSYAQDEKAKFILDHYAIYIIPRVSPEGAETYLKQAGMIRSINRMGKDLKGRVVEDLDQDGRIALMRVNSKYGAYKEEGQRWVKRAFYEQEGAFFHVLPESQDVTSLVNQTPYPLDFNRNFPTGWTSEAYQKGAGSYLLSNPECRHLADFILAHPNIGLASLGHTSGGLFLTPPGTYSAKKADKQDMKAYADLTKLGQKILGYEPMNIYDGFLSDQSHVDSGAFDDWLYQDQGILAMTVEYWDVASLAGVKMDYQTMDEDLAIERYFAIEKWVKENAPEALIQAKHLNHPTLGEVEIRGFDPKFTWQNPPVSFLAAELEKSTDFLSHMVLALPRLQVEKLSLNRIDTQTYEIKIQLANSGYLPTYISQQALTQKVVDLIQVQFEGVKVLAGPSEIEHLEGFGQNKVSTLYSMASQQLPDNIRELSWLVQGQPEAEFTCRISSQKAGCVQVKEKLPS